MTTLSLTEVKARLNELIDDAVRTHERVTITRHGTPAAVVLSVDDLESLEETLYWQEDRDIGDDIAAGRAEIEAGGGFDEASVRRRYGVGSAR